MSWREKPGRRFSRARQFGGNRASWDACPQGGTSSWFLIRIVPHMTATVKSCFQLRKGCAACNRLPAPIRISILRQCSSSPKRRLPRSALPTSSAANSRLPSSCASCSLASTMCRRGSARGRSRAGGRSLRLHPVKLRPIKPADGHPAFLRGRTRPSNRIACRRMISTANIPCMVATRGPRGLNRGARLRCCLVAPLRRRRTPTAPQLSITQ
jgi:hypothetical protein